MMITREQYNEGLRASAELLRKAGTPVTPEELEAAEITDFGLGNYPAEGAQIVTLLNTRKVALKIICLFQGQVLPEHMHIASMGEEGKEETFRVLYGVLHLVVPGWSERMAASPPPGKEEYYTCANETVMKAAGQITLEAGTSHWLMGGKGGCVVYSISSWARCQLDPFTDPHVVRKTVVEI